MAKVNFSNTESSLIKLFNDTKTFNYKGDQFIIVEIGKPSPSKGECKTDIYILAKNLNDESTKEFKISVKQINADFLENKMKLERAIEIFGTNAQEIIEKSTHEIKQSFEEEPLINFTKRGRTEAKTIALGWKFELLNKPGGLKSGLMLLTKKQKIDVYAGTNLGNPKTNCLVNGERIKDSGIADYILETDHNINGTADDYINQLETIEEFVDDKQIYFACKALNYRASKDKWDGDRPLAVYVDWEFNNNRLTGNLKYTNPLSVKGNQCGENVRKILNQLNIDKDNFDDLKQYYSE